jgi:hypothetical protein
LKEVSEMGKVFRNLTGGELTTDLVKKNGHRVYLKVGGSIKEEELDAKSLEKNLAKGGRLKSQLEKKMITDKEMIKGEAVSTKQLTEDEKKALKEKEKADEEAAKKVEHEAKEKEKADKKAAEEKAKEDKKKKDAEEELK